MIKKYLKILTVCVATLTIQSCGLDFLDTKPVKNQQVPATLDDFLAILDHTSLNSFPSYLSMIGAEEFWVTDAGWNNFPLGVQHYQKNAYIWAKNVYEGASAQDWDIGHGRILACNIVLDGLEKYAEEKDKPLYRQIKGTALFHRARFLYNLAQIFAPPFIPNNESKYGLPFYLTSAIVEPTYRRSVRQTYEQILSDLLEADNFLPE
ncbi:RagB/SusD family nutrient uptake outer membrane protein [Sphingobacterium alkalisoli]|uniref:RagB/SusD family nutrient uptake outer membrane protein n=1 Tax=Sphingobacterium alkalisoli TaxID=1874115 RepID=A0A4U0GMZ7_9SPHI|nr:RagB/SusD family nutrient uptake outer membrane protein [Sphingobacterium alkalisoli]TJY59694.1 RagB/SusD family nutrient uptake outer membrane protein [Sphingobacterium alkalisoli]GGH33072.1 hypothetical protein GCM10011418_47030 [Sphingobacterium alkalisoli]